MSKNAVFEVLLTDASDRLIENVKAELRNLLSGQGLSCGGAIETLSPEASTLSELAATGASSARIRLYEGGAL